MQIPAGRLARIFAPRFATGWLFLLYVTLGAGYLLVTPPFRTPDERNHFFRSYEICEGRFLPIRIDQDLAGDYLPTSLSRLAELVGVHSEMRADPAQLARARASPLAPNERQLTEFSSAPYAPLAYVPSAAAIAAARFCGAGPLALTYAARWANLLVAGALIAFAVATAGAARVTALLVSLFPMTISQVASASADAVSYGVAFVWISVVLATARPRREILTRGRIVLLIVLALALSQLRPPYPLLCALVFLIRPARLGKTAMAFVFYATVLVATAVPAIAWNTKAANLYVTPDPAQRIDPRAQLAAMTERPRVFWRVMTKSVRFGAVEYARELVGKLGWLNVPLPAWIHYGFAISCITGLFLGPLASSAIAWWQRAVLAVAIVGGINGIMMMLYLTFNPVGAPGIAGVQGRYFTAIAFIAAFAFAKPLNRLAAYRVALTAAIVAFAVAANAAAIWTLARAAGRV